MSSDSSRQQQNTLVLDPPIRRFSAEQQQANEEGIKQAKDDFKKRFGKMVVNERRKSNQSQHSNRQSMEEIQNDLENLANQGAIEPPLIVCGDDKCNI